MNKPFHVFCRTDGRRIADQIQQQMWSSRSDLSHLAPERDSYRNMGTDESLVASFATRDEAEAEAMRLQAAPRRFAEHVTYWAEFCNW